jgi:hypothetical protein
MKTPFAVLAAASLVVAASSSAGVPLDRISADPYSSQHDSNQHRTQVEPDSYSFGDTIVTGFQTGRAFSGGASNNGFSTSLDGGQNWTDGVLPGITQLEAGPWQRASDPVIAYSRKHERWLFSSLAFGGAQNAVVISRSDDGLNWSDPITVHQSGQALDKNWTSCDITPSSGHYGNCYTEWDNNSQGNLIQTSTSTDGGLTWGPPKPTANNGSGLGGLPVPKPNGEVVVPISGNFASILEYRSKNGGGTWSATKQIAQTIDHTVAGGLRSPPLPTADVDAGGKVYVVWQDCRFRTNCSSNDLVLSTNKKKRMWTQVTRIPIDPVTSGVDHFIPGLAVEPGTRGRNAHLALTYYYYPVANCSFSTCQLHVGFIESLDGGQTWSAPVDVAGPMQLSWLADTSSGRMVADYVSTSFNTSGGAHGVFAVANAPSGGVFDEAMYTTRAPLFGLRPPSRPVTPADRVPVTDRSDHPPYSIMTLN